ncbi:MAG: phosphatidylinositol N-acetylglucosaminyltransferase subunit gpi1 [Alyxoria varia]|nr:MAG: phosphatidylinositol N-acetylglucosaminyltransferase subunit gpi1 [Alyxoria varia]
MNHILHRCGPAKLEVLGIVNPKSAFTPCQDLPISAITTANSLLPNIVGPEDDTSNNQVILYARPHPDQLQYLSLEPISLRLEDVDGRAAHDTPLLEDVDAADKEDGGKDAELVQKLKLHTVKRFPPTEKELKIALVISQINCSLDIDAVLQRNIGMVRPRSKRAMSVSERVVESATNLWDYVQIFLWHIWSIWIYPVLRQSFILVLMAHRIAGESILLLARQPIGPQKTTLKDLSATAQQVDLRLQQFYYWPVQYLTLRDRKDNWQCISNNHAEYIRFYNSLWLVVNDAIMGIAFGAYVVDNAPFVAAQVTTLLGTWSLEGLRHIISWLMVYPGGLKLNNELARFLGDLFIWVIDYWGGMVVHHG